LKDEKSKSRKSTETVKGAAAKKGMSGKKSTKLAKSPVKQQKEKSHVSTA